METHSEKIIGRVDDMINETKSAEVIMALVTVRRMIREMMPHRIRRTKSEIKQSNTPTGIVEKYLTDMKKLSKRTTVLGVSHKFNIPLEDAKRIVSAFKGGVK